jgi:hypothetical protein
VTAEVLAGPPVEPPTEAFTEAFTERRRRPVFEDVHVNDVVGRKVVFGTARHPRRLLALSRSAARFVDYEIHYARTEAGPWRLVGVSVDGAAWSLSQRAVPRTPQRLTWEYTGAPDGPASVSGLEGLPGWLVEVVLRSWP